MEQQVVLDYIYNLVAVEFSIQFKCESKKADKVIARDFYYCLCVNNLSHEDLTVRHCKIASYVNRKRSAVSNGYKRVDNILFNNKELKPVYNKLDKLIKQKIKEHEISNK